MAEQKEPCRKILICVDGSNCSEAAFKWAARNVCKKGDHVICLHAVNFHPTITTLEQLATEEWRLMVQNEKDKVKKLEDVYKTLCEQEHMHAVIKVLPGDPLDCILKTSEKEEVDVIITGSRGLGVIRRTVLGSVSSGIVHNSKIPCIIVPDQPHHK